MRVLLDECVDWRLSRALTGHEVRSARQMGWSAVKNGELLELASERFDAFVTVDRNLAFQQNVRSLPIAVISPPCKNESACRPSAAGPESSNGDWFSKARSCYDRRRVSVIILEPARLLPLHHLLLLLAPPVVVRAAEAGRRGDVTFSRSTPPGC